ncbi:TolC family protein [Myroides odoratus]|uniref:TolC family protein n=1 Tax=Myroides odoratus TaxID=256 RepID=UPI0039B02DDA
MKINSRYSLGLGFLFTLTSFAQNSIVLELATCKQLALDHNKRITKVKRQLEASDQEVKAAKLGAYPMFDASLSGAYLGDPLGGAMKGLIPVKMVNASVSASVPLYAGGKIRNGVKASQSQQNIAQQTVTMTEREVLFETEKTYYEVVKLQEKEKLAQEYILLLEALEKDVKNSYEVGLIYKNDLLKVQVELTHARFGLKKVQDGKAMTVLALKQLIGMEEAQTLEVNQKLQGFDGMSVISSQQREASILERPEVQILEEVTHLEDIQAKMLKSDYYPTVGLRMIGLSGFGEGINFANGKDNLTSYVGLVSIEIPLFDWGKRGAKAKEQRLKALAAQEELEQTKELLDLEIRNAEIIVNQASQDVQSSELALDQSAENRRIVQDRFEAGTIVSKDVLEANALWQEAYSKVIEAKIVYLVNRANLNRVLGNL